jgi:hypothetical protein
VPVLQERLPCPEMPYVARAQRQICPPNPPPANPIRPPWLSNGGTPFHNAPHLHPERPNLAGKFLGRLGALTPRR